MAMTRRRRSRSEYVAWTVHALITDCLIYLLVIVTANTEQIQTFQLIH